jgi:glutathione peroxidase
VEFPLMDKVSVKGRDKHPVFEYLSSKKLNGYISFSPIWNFQKYLIDKKGYVRQYFLPVTSPESKRVKKTIEQLLHENI